MKQIVRLVSLVLIVGLVACSGNKPSANTGMARIRATALAAQQSDAQATPEASAPVQVEAAPVAIAQPQPNQAGANTSAVWPAPTDGQQLDLITALGVVLLVFALGCAVGSIITAYTLGRKEAKHV